MMLRYSRNHFSIHLHANSNIFPLFFLISSVFRSLSVNLVLPRFLFSTHFLNRFPFWHQNSFVSCFNERIIRRKRSEERKYSWNWRPPKLCAWISTQSQEDRVLFSACRLKNKRSANIPKKRALPQSTQSIWTHQTQFNSMVLLLFIDSNSR